MNSLRSWIVFAVAGIAYIVAVLQRTTLGVSAVAAQDRFDAPAAALSALAVVQLAVYAALQVPAGVLLDRFGPRTLLVAGTTVMAAGQFALAVSESLPLAVFGRILVGAGDAAVFISVVRLIPSWFSGRWVPQLTQWVGNVGQLGQILSAIPFAFLLHETGWTTAFLSAGAVAVLTAVTLLLALTDAPRGAPVTHSPRGLGHAVRELRAAFARPGTRLGFWTHFTTLSPAIVFGLFWGYPFMVIGLGYSRPQAAAMLTLLVVAGMVSAPVLGVLSARFPFRRSNLVIGVVLVVATAWTALLLWPGQPPLWLMAAVVVTMGVGGPGSMIGFDFARTFNPPRGLGVASGMVNVGGFLAGFLMVFLIGAALDTVSWLRMANGLPGEPYDLDAFRIAFLVQYVVVGAGVVFLVRERRRTRRRLDEDEGIRVAPVWVALWRWWRGRRRRGGPGSVQ